MTLPNLITLLLAGLTTMGLAIPTSDTTPLNTRQFGGGCQKCETEYKKCIAGDPVVADSAVNCKREICYNKGWGCNECRFCWK